MRFYASMLRVTSLRFIRQVMGQSVLHWMLLKVREEPTVRPGSRFLSRTPGILIQLTCRVFARSMLWLTFPPTFGTRDPLLTPCCRR